MVNENEPQAEPSEVQAEAKKPFDLHDLQERLKAKGLPHLEAGLKDAIEEVFAWTEEGVKATPTMLDDLALVVLPPVKAFVLGKLDGIAK